MTRNSYPSSADPVEVKMIGTVRWVPYRYARIASILSAPLRNTRKTRGTMTAMLRPAYGCPARTRSATVRGARDRRPVGSRGGPRCPIWPVVKVVGDGRSGGARPLYDHGRSDDQKFIPVVGGSRGG